MTVNSNRPIAAVATQQIQRSDSARSAKAKVRKKPPEISGATVRLKKSDGPTQEENKPWWNDQAKAAYLSFGFHAIIYALAAVLFYVFSDVLLDENLTVAVRARLAEEDVLDSAAFETAPEISVVSNETQDSEQQLASVLDTVDNDTLDTLNLLDQSLAGGKGDGDGQVGSLLFKLPESGLAVTKGSFTAWTIPENPAVGEWYKIIIEIRLPKKIRQYRLSDLSGNVIGTDGYNRRIPYDSRQSRLSAFVDENNKLQEIKSSSRVAPKENKVQLVLRIPPASINLTRDTIKIKSRRLRESQELTLTFGK